MTSSIRPGDLVLAHGRGPISAIIRFGQWLRPSWRPYRTWNHAALVVAVVDGRTRCVQMSRRCELVWLDEVSPGGRVEVRPCPEGVDRIRAVDWALQQTGIAYSWLTILSIALQLLTPKWLDVDFHESRRALICSALVARAWEHGAWNCPTDPFQITPAELARLTK